MRRMTYYCRECGIEIVSWGFCVQCLEDKRLQQKENELEAIRRLFKGIIGPKQE